MLDIKASLEDSFLEAVRKSTSLANGNLLVFVNGANDDFQNSLLSDATFLYDLNIDSTALDLNWPSGEITQYSCSRMRLASLPTVGERYSPA